MFLHVGNSKNLRESRIIGIFDADTSTVSQITRKFLSDAEKDGRAESAVLEIPKSFVISNENGTHKICFSQLSVLSLVGRSEGGYENNLSGYNKN